MTFRVLKIDTGSESSGTNQRKKNPLQASEYEEMGSDSGIQLVMQQQRLGTRSTAALLYGYSVVISSPCSHG